MRTLSVGLTLFVLIGQAHAQSVTETAAYILYGLEAGTPGFTRLPEPPLRFINSDGDTQLRFVELSPCIVTIYSDFVYRNSPTAMETRAVDFSRVAEVLHADGMNTVIVSGAPIASCDKVKAKCENVDWSKWSTNVDKERLSKANAHMRKLCPRSAF